MRGRGGAGLRRHRAAAPKIERATATPRLPSQAGKGESEGKWESPSAVPGSPEPLPVRHGVARGLGRRVQWACGGMAGGKSTRTAGAGACAA